MKNLLRIQKVICTLTDIREIRALVDSLYTQQTRIERYLALFFSIGDRVAFDSHFETLRGIVTRVNQVTVQVSVDDIPGQSENTDFRLWKVPASKLRFLEKIGKADFTPFEIAPPVYDETVMKDSRR